LVNEPRAWQVVFTRQAQKDARKLADSGPREQAEELLEILRTDPWQQPPRFEKLVGDLAGAYSRRINVQHRLVYQILPKPRTVKVLRMWTHYE
jgi:toxin YoeB